MSAAWWDKTVTIFHRVSQKINGRTKTSWRRNIYSATFRGSVQRRLRSDNDLRKRDHEIVRIPGSIDLTPGDFVFDGVIDHNLPDDTMPAIGESDAILYIRDTGDSKKIVMDTGEPVLILLAGAETGFEVKSVRQNDEVPGIAHTRGESGDL